MNSPVEIYNDGNETQIEVRFDNETVWLNLNQLAELFGRDKSVISRHLKNIFNEGELSKSATVAKNATVQKEGDREINRQIEYYNLDAIISVGYRVNSKQGTQFRIWATNRLKEYLIQGYSINERRLAQKDQEVKILKEGYKILGRYIEEKTNSQELEWLERFSMGLKLLDDYDHESLDKEGITTKDVKYPEESEYATLIEEMKSEFSSDVFGIEKDDGFKSATAQISKGFGENDFYPSLEEKAAVLLYLIIKNHAFTDGNKRIAAACFLLFLEYNNALYNKNNDPIISNEALASITLFVASSKPEEMETVKKLIISILNRNSMIRE